LKDIEIEIAEEKLIVNNVPETSWEALTPYWPPIAKAIIEVYLEGRFKPYSVSKDRKDGFYAGEWYWKRSLRYPDKYPLKETKRFLKMLSKKKCFLESVKEFNRLRQTDWTSKENIKQLRQFIYTACHELEGFLGTLK
jgi:hypothetical protein